MKIKEVREIIDEFPDDTEIVIGSWFEDGTRFWRTNAPVSDQEIFFKKTNKLMLFYFDNCIADRDIELEK